MSLILYNSTSWTSPYVLSCFVALRAKRVPFEIREIATEDGEHLEAAFASKSLTARIPMLLDGDFALSESSAIVEYIEERYPAPPYSRLLPEAERARARARQVMAWIRSDLMPIRVERSAEYVFYSHDCLAPLAPLSKDGLRAATKLLRVADALVPKDAGNLFGSWCIADTDLAMMLQRLVKTGHDVPERIREYASREWQRPSVVEFCEHARPAFRPTTMG